GAVLTVSVWKKGYYVVDGQSTGTFAYGLPPDQNRRTPPTKGNPAVFVLRKAGPTDRLIHSESTQIEIPANGVPVNVDLAKGRIGQGDLQIQSWLGDVAKRPFSWRFRLAIHTGGGLMERKEAFAF